MITITEHLYYQRIQVINPKGRDTVEFFIWRNIPWHVLQKWLWYFKYRAALLQVKYPKFEVQHTWGKENIIPANHSAKVLKNKIQGKKSSITKNGIKIQVLSDRLQKAKSEWMQLFPITEDKDYIEAMQYLDKWKLKKSRLEAELIELEKNVIHDEEF